MSYDEVAHERERERERELTFEERNPIKLIMEDEIEIASELSVGPEVKEIK